MTCTGGCLALLLAAVASACTRLPEARQTGAFAVDTLPDSASVPSSWGNLVSVTVNPAFTDVFQLWFQDPAGKVHLVVYDIRKVQLSRGAVVITRR
jgi:hypothetical protein